MSPVETGERLQKILARRGYGSRREVERLISSGQVTLNGRVATLGNRATVDDKVVVTGKEVDLSKEAGRIVALNKPCGFVVSRSPQNAQRSVFCLLPERYKNEWISVGRLDINTSGLLLMTNDGDLAHGLTHPSSCVPRVYMVRVKGEVTDKMMQTLQAGVMLDKRKAAFDTVEPVRETRGLNRWFRVSLREGRNREVRRLWATQGLEVSRLIRTEYGSLSLDVPVGKWRELTADETSGLYADAHLEYVG